jgi:hypothetical protein
MLYPLLFPASLTILIAEKASNASISCSGVAPFAWLRCSTRTLKQVQASAVALLLSQAGTTESTSEVLLQLL